MGHAHFHDLSHAPRLTLVQRIHAFAAQRNPNGVSEHLSTATTDAFQ
jgi:hypothetical protein